MEVTSFEPQANHHGRDFHGHDFERRLEEIGAEPHVRHKRTQCVVQWYSAVEWIYPGQKNVAPWSEKAITMSETAWNKQSPVMDECPKRLNQSRPLWNVTKCCKVFGRNLMFPKQLDAQIGQRRTSRLWIDIVIRTTILWMKFLLAEWVELHMERVEKYPRFLPANHLSGCGLIWNKGRVNIWNDHKSQK